ncbi:MAG: hypothetical protein WAT91_16250 [Saprospiraceae bacterium]
MPKLIYKVHFIGILQSWMGRGNQQVESTPGPQVGARFTLMPPDSVYGKKAILTCNY